MPKYEIGYILSSSIADDEVPQVAAELSKSIQDAGAKILNEDHWGRRKLAYPIGRTRNGYYVFITADIPANKVAEVEHKLRTSEPVIRFMVVNMEEADKRKARDAEARANRPSPAPKPQSDVGAKDEESSIDLDKEIEKAISGEEEKI